MKDATGFPIGGFVKRLTPLFLFLIAGCLPVYHQKMWESHPPADTTPASFPGITSPTLQPVPSDHPPGEPLDFEPVKVFIVHGMGDQRLGFANDTIERLSEKLHLKRVGGHVDRPIRHPGFDGVDYGTLRVDTFSFGPQQEVRFYSLLWSPLALTLERKYVQYDWAGPTHGRVWADRKLKKSLIDKAITDAVAYAGPFHAHMQYSVRQGLCALITETSTLEKECKWELLSPSAKIHIITHSLGSIMLLETLEEMVRARGLSETAADKLIIETRLVALLANQFPLFRLARLQTPTAVPSGSDELRQLFNERAARPDLPLLPFVAFSDPNDLLSFPIPDDWNVTLFPELAQNARFINVAVNNTWPVAGIVALPPQAHGGYWTNDWIIELLAHGSKGVSRR